MKRRTTPPNPYLPPQTRTRHRLSHRPHRQCRCGVIPLPQRVLHPTNHVQQETHPTDNSHSCRGRTGRERHDVEADVDEGDPQVQTATDRVEHATSPHHNRHPPATRRTPHRTSSQTTHTTGNPHTAGDGHRPEDTHDAPPQCVGVPRATHADSHA